MSATNNLLPFQRDFKIKDLNNIKYKVSTTENGTTEYKTKVVTTISAGATKLHILHSLSDFNKARTTMGWTTGPKLFLMIDDIFEDEYDAEWWTDAKVGISETVQHFDDLIKDFIKMKFCNTIDTYQKHKRLLEKIKKTRDLWVIDFNNLLKFYSISMVPKLPGAPRPDSAARLQSEEYKFIVF